MGSLLLLVSWKIWKEHSKNVEEKRAISDLLKIKEEAVHGLAGAKHFVDTELHQTLLNALECATIVKTINTAKTLGGPV